MRCPNIVFVLRNRRRTCVALVKFWRTSDMKKLCWLGRWSKRRTKISAFWSGVSLESTSQVTESSAVMDWMLSLPKYFSHSLIRTKQYRLFVTTCYTYTQAGQEGLLIIINLLRVFCKILPGFKSLSTIIWPFQCPYTRTRGVGSSKDDVCHMILLIITITTRSSIKWNWHSWTEWQ